MNKILTILFLLCFACCGFAQTLWTGDVSADWHDAGNWTQGVPTTGQTATIPGSAQGGVFPTVSQVLVIDFTIQSFGGSIIFMADAFNNGSVVNSSGGTMTLSNGATFTNSGTVTFLNDGVFDNDGTFINYGTFNQNGNGIFNNNPQGNFINFGTIGNIGNYNNDGTLENRGQLTNSSQFTNNGITRNYGFFSNTFVSTFTNATGGQFFNETGAQLFIDNTFNNNGQITDNGSTSVNGQGMINNNGTMNLNGLYSVGTMFNNDGTVNNSGNFRINFGTVNNNSTWNNTGSLNNTGRLNNNAGANLNNTASLSVASCSKLFQYSSNVIDAVTNDGVIYEVSGTVNTNASSQGQELTDENANPLPFVQCKDINIQLDATGNVDITPGDLIVDADAKYCNIVTVAADQTSFSCADLGPNTVEFSITDGFGGTSTCNSIVTIIEKSPNPCNTSFLNYCTASATNANSEWIQSVAMTTLNNNSGDDGGYADYTNLVAELDFGNFYDLTLTPGFPGSPNNVAWRVWIDWNIDGDFDDDGELVVSEDAAMQVVGSINVPGTAVPGTTRMRVTTKRFPAVNACGTYPNGEVEDYTIKVNSDIIIQQCPDNQVVSAQPGQTTAPAGWIPAKGFSTCPNSIEIELIEGLPNGSQFPLGVTTNTLQFTDGCDGVKDCSFTITVNSTPVNFSLDCPSDIILMGNADLGGAIANWIPPFPTATCPQGLSLPTQISGPAFGDFLPMGSSTQICYETSDNCGNVDNCCFFIFVQDPNNSLTFNNCPTSDIVIDAQPGATGATATYANLTTTSDCPTGGVTLDILDGLPSGSIFPIGTTQVVYRAFDDCNSADLCEFNVTVNATPSTISSNCPDNIVLSAAPGAFSQEVSWAAVTASSDCASGSISVAQTEGLPNGSAFPVGNTVIIYTISDGCGNAEICNFNVTINVSAATLDLNCPADITVDAAPGEVGTVVTWADPAISTDCFNGGAAATLVSPLASGSTFPLGSKEVIYFGSDDCGNTASCSFFVNVNPVSASLNITCPNDIVQTVNVNQNSATATWSAPTTSTTCSGNVSTTQIAGAASGSAFDAGVTTITYSASDDCGNVEICSFTVTVDVNIPADDPEIDLTCLNDITVTAAPGATSASVGFDVPTATTTCNAGGGGNNGGGSNGGSGGFDCSQAPTPGNNAVNCCSLQSNTIPGFTYMGEYGGSKYYCSQTNATWEAARLSCFQNGGYLAAVNNAGENEFLRTNMVADEAWLGLTDEANEGTFTWIYGGGSYLNWPSGEPNDDDPVYTDGADYAAIIKATGLWFDRSGQNEYEYILEIPCSCSAPNFTQIGEFEGSKYYLSNNYETWSNAQAIASANGANLVTINSQAENDYINSITSDAIWIGLSDENVENSFQWADGSPATYFNWSGGQPDNWPAGGGEDYVAMLTSGQWNDERAVSEHRYVIEVACPLAPAACAAPDNISGFTLVGEFENSKYYIYNSATSWTTAKNIAAQNGGYLATVSSHAENAFIQNNTNPASGSVWIGYNAIGTSTFSWDNGEPNAYENWQTGEPNETTSDVAARLKKDNGKWTDRFLTINYEFVMEIPCGGSGGCGRVTDGLQVLYDFQEGSGSTITDVSGVGTPLNLTIANPNNTNWIQGGCGLSVNAGTIAQSGGAASKIISAVKNSHEITMEAWVKPANTTQNGPARIFTISSNTISRNATLGQEYHDYVARLRTTTTTTNGVPNAHGAGVQTNLQHVVYTRNAAGTERIYVNGNQVFSGTRQGDMSGWDNNYQFALFNELTNDRAWQGEMYLAAVYSKALSSAEVQQNYGAGECCSSGNPTPCTPTGTLTREVWTGLPSSNSVASIPVNTAPNTTDEVNIFEVPVNAADNYGTRLSGYIIAPQTGNYTFWIASDDNGELWLSSDANPANKALIANVPGWTSSQQWDKFPEQQSATVALVAGQAYYIEALAREGTGGDNLAVGWQLPDNTLDRPISGQYLSTSACGGGNGGSSDATVTQIAGNAPNMQFPVGTTTVIYQATDDCGNVDYCSFDVTVLAPATNLSLNDCPADITVQTAAGDDTAIASWTAPTATSDCATGDVVVSQVAGFASGSAFPTGVTTVTYRAVDGCGNEQLCSFFVTVEGTPAPPTEITVNCVENFTIQTLPGDNSAVATWTEPTGTTTCAGSDVEVIQIGGLPNGGNFPIGTTVIFYRLEDDCGNVQSCAFNVTVEAVDSNIDITCPPNVNVNADPDADYGLATFAAATATSTCYTGTPSVAQIAGLPSGSLFPVGNSLVFFRATDDCGNVDVCNFVVTVNATPITNIDPCINDGGDSDNDGVCDDNDICAGFDDNIDTDGDGTPDGCDTCPNDATGDSDGDGVCDSDDICAGFDDNLDSDGDGTPDGCDTCPNDATGDSDGDGVCDSDDICAGFDDNLDSDNDGTPDGCDVCPADANNDSDGDGVCDSDDICAGSDDNADLDGDGTPDGCDICPADVNDDSDGDGICDFEDICPGFDDLADADGDGIPDGCDDLNCACDANGDTTAPTLQGVPADVIVECDNIPTAATVSALDECSGAITPTFSENIVSGVCANSYSIERIWTATDDCGNTFVQTQTITVQDTQAPTFTNAPADVTVTAGNLPTDEPIFADKCDNNLTIVTDDFILYPDDNCNDFYTIDRVWTATDACGNQTAVTQIITVLDDSNILDDDNDGVCNANDICPGFDDNEDLNNNGIPDGCEGAITLTSCPDFISYGIPFNNPQDGDDVTWIEPTATTSCPDGGLTITQTAGQNNGSFFQAGTVYTITYLIEDACGNTATCTFEISLGSEVGYTFCPADINVTTDSMTAIASWTEPNPESSCGNTSGSYDQSGTALNGTAFPIGTTEVIYLYTDGCGNQAQCSFNVTVTSTACDDDDNDGVCNEDDQCEGFDDSIDMDNDGIIDGCDPCQTGATCDDGDATTENDVFDANCGCAGTPINNEPDCDNITITAGANSIIVTNLGGAPISSLQIFNSTWGGEFNCFADCNDTETVPVTPGTYYVYAKYYEANYQLICQNVQTITVTDAPCDDDDNDGVCNAVDQCEGFDDSIDMDNDGIIDGCDPCITGATCDDGNPNTINDAFDADCNCIGENPNGPCFGTTAGNACDDGDPCTFNDTIDNDCNCVGTQDADDDGDGVCDAIDQCPNSDDNIDVDNDGIPDGCDPCITGATCDDGDANTNNDVFDENCNCAGTTGPVEPDCDNISITAGANSIIVTNLGGAPISSLQIFNSSWGGEFSCFADCNDTETVSVTPGTYYVYAKYYEANYQLICQNVQTITVTDAPCDDDDNDGVCNDVDECEGFDDSIDMDNDGIPDGCDPCQTGATCDDGNAATINDAFDADCNCIGEIDECNGTPDSDGDGVCDALDVCPGFDDFEDVDNDSIADGCDPCITGAACDDGDANTENDVYDANCGCAGTPVGCDDDDNDGVCNADDQCEGFDDSIDVDNDGIIDGCDPCITGAPCDDGDANTENDVYDANCGCAGTPIGGGDPDCADISITVDNGNIVVTNLDGAPISSLQIFNASYQTEFSCFADCSATESVPVAAGTYFVYAKYYTAAYQLICENVQTVTVTNGGGGCTDADGDGYCVADDCDDTDATLPATPGTSCNDGDPNTTGDQIQADGCTCEGTPVNPGDPNCADISITTDAAHIIVSGLDGAPVTSLQIFNASYQTEFSCFADCNTTESIPLGAGTYYVYAKYYNAQYQLICEVVETINKGVNSVAIPNDTGVLEVEQIKTTINRSNFRKNATPDINIFPNPATETVKLSVKDFAGQAGMVMVYDLFGKAVYQQDFLSLPAEPMDLNLTDYRSGVYHVTVAVEGYRLMTKKLVVQD